MDQRSPPERRRGVVLVGSSSMDPYFYGAFFAIIWLSASLFAADLLNQREAELRLTRVPAHVR